MEEKEKNIEIEINILISHLPPTLKQKFKVFFRDKFKCLNCEDDKDLHLHHIDHNHKNNNIDNLMTLCSFCHRRYHTYGEF